MDMPSFASLDGSDRLCPTIERFFKFFLLDRYNGISIDSALIIKTTDNEKSGSLVKGGNADRGFFNESNLYFLCPAPNIQQNLKCHHQIYHHIITLHSV
jgi:hypothetical protein